MYVSVFSSFNRGMIHNFVYQAFSIQWAFFFFPTVALSLTVLSLLFYFGVLQYGFVVAIYQLLDIGHTAVAEFQGISVK